MNFRKQMRVNFLPVLNKYIGKPFRFLEIGVFRGLTATWILNNIATNKDSKIIGIDPWERHLYAMRNITTDEEWNDLLSNIDKIQIKSNGKIEFIKGYSHEVLKNKLFEDEYFDCIYIDADHTTKSVLTDFNITWPLLKINGIMIFDDYKMGGNKNQVKNAVDKILIDNSNKLELVFKNRQVGIRKIAE
jgi:predicted O-methyltransferase YrrM